MFYGGISLSLMFVVARALTLTSFFLCFKNQYWRKAVATFRQLFSLTGELSLRPFFTQSFSYTIFQFTFVLGLIVITDNHDENRHSQILKFRNKTESDSIMFVTSVPGFDFTTPQSRLPKREP